MTDRVVVEVDGHIATVTLNRPDKYNAFDDQMFDALSATGNALAARDDVHVIILAGAGGNFSAGLDISGMGRGDDPTAEFAEVAFEPVSGTPANRFQHPAWVWHSAPQPVIAAIEGVCFGAGLQVAAGADIRYAAPDARLSIMEVKWGLVPDMGFTAVMRDVMRLDQLKELAYSGRVISGEQAVGYELVSATHENPLVAAQALAKDIVGRSPDAVRATKHLVNEGWRQSPEGSLRLEAELQLEMVGKPNQLEAVMSNIQKRAPRYKPPVFSRHKKKGD